MPMKKIWKWLNNSMVLSALLAVVLISCLISLGQRYELSKSDWASWVQAIGAILAIAGAFGVASWQYDQARADEARRFVREKEDVRNAAIYARALAVRNTVQVATYALDNAREIVLRVRENQGLPEADSYFARTDHLRTVLDTHITPAAEHLAVVSALGISQVLAQVHSDMRRLPEIGRDVALQRCDKHLQRGDDLLMRLVDFQIRLDELCRDYGLPLEINDLRRPI